MHHELREFADADTLGAAAASYVAEQARRAVDEKGSFRLALSGGRTPWTMFHQLRSCDMPWAETEIFQVDERVGASQDPARNLTNLLEALDNVTVKIEPMPVEDLDLDAAADRYAALLPEHLDLVHLGLGPDGHTASLVPGDPVLDVRDRLVATTGVYQGHRRMTLTYRALARANQLLWLVSGSDKRRALSLLLQSDTSIPAGRVAAPSSLIMADRTARWT